MPLDADPFLDDRIALTRRPEGRPVMHQRWHDLLFLHWEVPAEALARLIPPGLVVDTFEDRAYVGLVPFGMAGVRPRGLPSVGWLSNFPETNVRTYVRTPQGKPGVWFFSLDAGNPVATFLGRHWFRLPYYHARMRLNATEGESGSRTLMYESRRFVRRDVPEADTTVRAVADGTIAPAEQGTLLYFLAERYLLYAPARRGGGLLRGRVHHSAYPLRPARVLDLDESALAACGIERPDAAPLAHYAREVVVEVFPLEPVGGLSRPDQPARPDLVTRT